jgi:hypothetical protein
LAEIRAALHHLLTMPSNSVPWPLSFRVDDPLEEVEVSPTDIQIGGDNDVFVAGKIFGDARLMEVSITYNPEGPDGLMLILEDEDDAALPGGSIFVRQGENGLVVAEDYRR